MAMGLEAARESGRQPGGVAVALEGVSMTFGGADVGQAVRALQDINLEIRSGAFVALIGPSGCGKSTLWRLLGDLLAPTSGSIRVNGRSPREARLAREYGIVFQQPVLYGWRTVMQNVQLPLEVMRVPADQRRQRATALLQLVALTEFAERYPWGLAGGRQRRASSARPRPSIPSPLPLTCPFA